jgi:hypothetical protein
VPFYTCQALVDKQTFLKTKMYIQIVRCPRIGATNYLENQGDTNAITRDRRITPSPTLPPKIPRDQDDVAVRFEAGDHSDVPAAATTHDRDGSD